MTAAAVTLWQALACLGLGSAILAACGLHRALPWGEGLAWRFALGFGGLGWLVFPLGVAGLLDTWALAALLAAALAGLIWIGRPDGRAATPWRPVEWLLLAGLAGIGAVDLLEALAPPLDADSLAYHFDLPRRFLEAGALTFVPRAIDGAVPMLVQMTYVPVLGLGGEPAMTLWTGVAGWAAVGLLYALCRRHLDRAWSLAAALLLASTPAVIAGAGTGQVEIRMALLAMAAAVAAAESLNRGDGRWILVAGLAAGFLAGAKYTGLLFVLAFGLICLTRRGWLRRGSLYSVAALIGGFQWYLWNAVHTGDPVFPLLYPWLGADSGLWTAAHQATMQQTFFGIELPLARDVWHFIAYPFVATLGGAPVMESGRTGLGPWGLLVVPMAAMGAWRYRDRLRGHPLLPVAMALIVVYTLWFFTGSSQRVRHLVPVYPLFLLLAMVAAHRGAAILGTRAPLAAACAAAIAIQGAAQGLYGLPYLRHAASGEAPEALIAGAVSGYAAVPWINRNLSAEGDRLLLLQRQIVYYIEPPAWYAHPANQALVDVRADARDPVRYWNQVRSLGITHILETYAPGRPAFDGGFRYLNQVLRETGCARVAFDTEATGRASRTLPTLSTSSIRQRVLEIDESACGLGR